MMKVVGVLAFAAMMLVAGVTEVPAVAFNSAGGQGSCSGTATLEFLFQEPEQMSRMPHITPPWISHLTDQVLDDVWICC